MKFGVLDMPNAPSHDIVLLAKVAEEVGWDSFWVEDELPPPGLFRDELLTLTHVALSTTRITVGLGTYGYTRHPAWLAKAVGTLDEISGGRAAMILVVGRELGRKEKSTGIDFPLELSSSPVYKEIVQICKGLWSGKPFTYHGKMYHLQNTQLKVKCRTDIPLIVEGYGAERHTMAGMYADGLALYAVPAEHVPFGKKNFEEAMKKTGRKPPYTLNVGLLTSVAKTREDARKTLEHLILFPIRLFYFRPHVLTSVGLTKEDLAPAVKKGVKLGKANTKMLKPEVAETLMNKFLLCGTPDDIIERIRDYEKAGVTSLELSIARYPFSTTTMMEQIRMIGEEVIPSFKP